MAGTGVGVGGGGMLRTRRRDVSVKPNRKLDRKSSRGMIYENEELRLRTIHINAEVEQGQNDIKKLRRENEQLRREIWSLRDEYDKLEEILKRQKIRGESEEYEDRSEEDDGLQSDFSCEEDVDVEREEYDGDNDKTAKGFNQEEQLENAENQKISFEKMSSSLHRLHVEFDDLSVVDEEEELKKDKERKETTPSLEEQRSDGGRHLPPPFSGPRQLHDNIPFYPATYEPTSAFSETSYYTECPFEFPNTIDLMLPTDTLLPSPCSGLQSDPLVPLASLDSRSLDQVAEQMLPRIHVPPVGWQNDVVPPPRQPPAYSGANVIPDATTKMQTTGMPESKMTVSPDVYGFLRRRNARQLTRMPDASTLEDSQAWFSSREEAVARDAWDVGEDFTDGKDASAELRKTEEVATSTAPERPKHFFAPLPSKLKRQEEESPTASHFGTGTSSSSGKTVSTVVSRVNPFVGQQKGSADIYVNGAVAYDGENVSKERDESRTFFSTDDLLLAEHSRTAAVHASGGQLTKSVSCQDLSSECPGMALQQSKLSHAADGKPQMLTKSDNTLDNITSGSSPGRPYKSHLNVTLRVPRMEQAQSPETPEIPNLPSIDYRLFRNPFLRNLDKLWPSYRLESSPPATKPLSVQVNDDAYQYNLPTYGRAVHLDESFRAAQLPDKNRLLIPSDQVLGSKQDIQITSFERPSPCTLIPSAASYDLSTLRRLNANRYLQSQNSYQNVPSFVASSRTGGQFYPQRPGGIVGYYDQLAIKIPAQTQTSIDGDSHHEDEHPDEETTSAPNSPSGQRRKRVMSRRDKATLKDQRPLSPAAQRRLRKQSSVTSTDIPDSPDKMARKRPRKLSTTTTSDVQEDKNESRSSSSGQDSPRKDQNRRVSVYINSKRRSSQTSLKTSRSGSVDATKDKYADAAGVPSSERERTNSISSREIAGVKARKTSTSSGNVPWCACWGNGCI
ncbi:uncharacterized protein LOC105186433 isoform X2 [Harpegnathos saltator]|uniref:uncharacterized protein LOC105186433 isoform X2 n=1 Tax=Harpegnathos saltator TaxID=610380 RepID=UPI00058F1BCE|nr:uncharacterized protein LOC105186433 isoform X2 [Harpegnathos saltator]